MTIVKSKITTRAIEKNMMKQREIDRQKKSNAIIHNSLFFAAQDRKLSLVESEGRYNIKRILKEKKEEKKEKKKDETCRLL